MRVRWKPDGDSVARIQYYEAIFQQLQAALADFEKAFQIWADLQPKMAEMEVYYTSPFWRQPLKEEAAGHEKEGEENRYDIRSKS